MQVYEGNEKYIFVSYAHKDSDRVLPIVEALATQGYRVWYDSGIVAGAEWPEYIAEHLLGSGCVLAFMSENFAASDNCKQEINIALKYKRNVLIVYLEPTVLSPGLEMRIDLIQSIFLYRHDSEESFMAELGKVQPLESCLSGGVEETPDPPLPKVKKTSTSTKTPQDIDRLAKKHKESTDGDKKRSKMRTGMLICMILAILASLFFASAALISQEYSTFGATAYNLVVALMFLALGQTSKNSEFIHLFGNRIKLKKRTFVWLCLILAAVAFVLVYRLGR